MRKRLVLVDGYNLIKNDPALSASEARSLESGRRALISRLLTSFDQHANDIIVVFDGSASPLPAPASERHGSVRVLFTRGGETADTLIKRLLAAEPPGRQVVLLSDDRELREVVLARGGIVGGAADRKPVCHSHSVTTDKDTDNLLSPARSKKGNPHRAKRRARGRPGVRW